jgi:hypothetical protein
MPQSASRSGRRKSLLAFPRHEHHRKHTVIRGSEITFSRATWDSYAAAADLDTRVALTFICHTYEVNPLQVRYMEMCFKQNQHFEAWNLNNI